MNLLKPIAAALVLTVLFFSCPLPLAAQNAGFVSTKGKTVVLPDGRPFIMRGTNLGNWLVPEGYMFLFKNVNSPRLIDQLLRELVGPAEANAFWKTYLDNYITEADIHFLKSSGMNSIRIPFNFRLFTKEWYLGKSDENHGFELLDKVIGWCKKEKLYVILDMHCAPGGQTGDNIDDGDGYPFLFESEKSQQLCSDIWKRIAAHYAKEPIVIGYDLLNEPIATYFDKDHFNPFLEPLYKKITAAIRTVDPNHIIILGGAQWDSNFEPFGKPFDSRLIYQFHKYWTNPSKEVIADYLAYSEKYQVPVYCGETGENTNGWVDSFRTTLEQDAVGWHYWPYKKMESDRGVVRIKKPAYYDEILAYAEADRSDFDKIRKNRPKDMDHIRQALKEYLVNCRFDQCIRNEGYIGALGFKPVK